MTCVLITGATGAVGSALVPLFLRDDATSIRLVIRARDTAHLQERLTSLFHFWGVSAESISRRITAVAGDVTQPQLGLANDDYQRLCQEVTHIVHSAGNVKLNQPIDDARRSAVESAHHVVTMARQCTSFRKLEFVSTVGVAGRTSGLIPEQPLTHRREFHNTYEQAKAEAEAFLLKQIGEGLPATIHRPSMVVGDSRSGAVIHFQVFYFLAEFFIGRNTWGLVPATGEVRLDIIPSDYVARAIHLSSQRPDAVGHVFHLCSGPVHSQPIADLTEELRRLFQSHGDRLPRLRRIAPRWLRRMLPVLRPIVPRKTQRLLQSLPFFLDYLEEEQLFDNTQTQSYFSPLGLQVPSVRDYLPQLIDYYRLKKPRPARP